MFSADQYELLDFGHGRKLERFGPLVLDRPAPAAVRIAGGGAALWRSADARYARDDAARGAWSLRGEPATCWCVQHGPVVFELRRTSSGAIGIYPEQAENWDWLGRPVHRAGRRLRVLNLFAHTGGSTLVAAAAGAEVVHVDASKSAVRWARNNARRSGLEGAPIRWIVEDARKFTDRELRRGRQYDAVVLDPPTYGHGPKAESWKLDQHLYDLLRACGRLTQERRAFILLTCHDPAVGLPEIEAMLADTFFGHCQSGVGSKRLVTRTGDGRRLASGVAARWPR